MGVIYMKKTICKLALFIFCVVGITFMCACEKKKNIELEYHKTDYLLLKDVDGVVFEEPVLPDAKTAWEYAELVFTKLFGSHKDKRTEHNVGYNEKEEIWFVSFHPSKNSDIKVVHFSIKKQTGEILCIWGGGEE